MKYVWWGGILCLLCVMIPRAGAAQPGAPLQPSCIQEKKTLARADDFIIIHGDKIKENLNHPIGELSLLAVRGDRLEPIPFQVDEVDPEGEWVLTDIPPVLTDTSLEPDRDDDDGELDANDELALMARDVGDRLREECYPEDALRVDEIALEDPIDGGRAWIYLAAFPHDPPRSEKKYVAFDTEADRITSANYDMRLSPELPLAPGAISLHGGKNILDQMKLRIHLKIFGVPFSLNEQQMVSKLSLFKAGPIRIIRRSHTAVKFTKIFRTPYLAIENIYYENAALVPLRLMIPFNLKWFAKIVSVDVRVGADFQNMHGWKFRTNCDDCWVNIDGKMDEKENNLKGEDFHWFLCAGPRNAFMIRMIYNKRPDGSFQDTPVNAALYYMDDDALPDQPECVPGQSPNVGYRLQHLTELSRGLLYFYAILVSFRDYQSGDEEKFNSYIDHPIQVK